MTAAFILAGIGVLMILYAYLSYKITERKLAQLKQEDLVAYYLDLAYRLLPVPFWSVLIGIGLLVTAVIILLIQAAAKVA